MIDPLDNTIPKKFGKKERQEYAIKKKAEEDAKAFSDEKVISKTSEAFKNHVRKERQRLGLETKSHSMFCPSCYSQRCVCDDSI